MWNSVSNKVQELPSLIKNKSEWNKKNDEQTATRELPGLIRNNSARKRKKKKKTDEPTTIFPPEVIIEILSWLPLKYLSQVQLVCKEWQAVIRDHYFIEKRMCRSSVVKYCWLNVVRSHTNLNSQPGPHSFSYIHGCDGLILVRNKSSHKYFILNSAMCLALELPDPHDGSYGFAFCYVPATRNYIIVSIYRDKEFGGESCEVLTPGPSMSWRRLTFPDIANANEHVRKEKVSVVSAGGAVHCVLATKVDKETAAEIATLDLETERFTVNHLPDGLFHDMKTVWELDWDGKLAFADIVGQNLQLMELEDYKKQRWCEKKKIIPLPFLKDNGVHKNVIPLFNEQGDIWFWLQNEKVFVYKIKTGKVTRNLKSKAFSLKNKLYPYKPSLVVFEGMQPDRNLEKVRSRLWFD